MSVQVLESFLKGRFVSGDGPWASLVNPTTEAVIARCSTGGLAFGAALAYGRDVGGPALRAMRVAARGALLSDIANAVHAHREELVALAIENGGNTRGDAKFDIDGGTGTMMYYAGLAAELGERGLGVEPGVVALTRSPRYVGRHMLTPIPGIALHINAFNFPAWGMMEKAAVALLAGVPVVTKPATSTAVVAERIMRIIANVDGLPEGALQMVTGAAGDLLSHLRAGDAVAFTGSSGIGRVVRREVAGGVRVNVEADSLNAVVVGPDVSPGSATWELFVREAVREMTQKAGQKCTATRRIFVPAERLDEAAADLCEELGEICVGDPGQKGVRMGPLTSKRQLESVQQGVSRLLESCEAVFGDGGRGELLGAEPDTGCFISPVLLKAPAWDTPVVHEDEVFGPVATLVPYDGSAEQAVKGVALGRGGLVATIYTDNREFAAAAVKGIATWSGRITLGSARVAEHSPGPGVVMPQLVHGGPGRAGGGEELGGARGLQFYQQRTAIQGSKPLLEKLLGV